MNIVILYTTIEGQTRKIAEAAAGFFESRGWRVSIANLNAMMEFGLERPDAVLVLAPVHAARYPSPLIDFLAREKDWLNSLPSAFVSISLSIASDMSDDREEAIAYPQALLAETGWKPVALQNAAGALRLDDRDYFKRWMVRRLSKHTGGKTGADGGREFTDFAELEAFYESFSVKVAAAGHG